MIVSRIVLHADLDCFYASVERRGNPELEGQPLVVGADPRGGAGRGVVLTASYEARKFGLRSGMPISRAFRLCPNAIYMRPDFSKYVEISRQVMALLRGYSMSFQSGGLDEAYLDITDRCGSYEEAGQTAERIKDQVHGEIGITCSIGVGPTKVLAKIATDLHKPNGVTVVTPETIQAILGGLDVGCIPGIGKKTLPFYHDKGLLTVDDIFSRSVPQLSALVGARTARWLNSVVHGFDGSPVSEHHGRQSIGKERTFQEDTRDAPFITEKLRALNHSINELAAEKGVFYKTVTLKVRFQDFKTVSRSISMPRMMRDEGKSFALIEKMLAPCLNDGRKIRLVGIKISNLDGYSGSKQATILDFA
jgi:DNA polymerase IV (DinB-like DNA polymerase)